MTTNSKQKIFEELDNISDSFINELLDFIHYLKFRSKEQDEHKDMTLTYLASEKSLGNEWLKSEEDEIWKDL